MHSKTLTHTLYKGLLRAARKLELAGVPPGDLACVTPRALQPVTASPLALVRSAFRHPGLRLDDAMVALPFANGLAQRLSENIARAAEGIVEPSANGRGPFSLGTVFRHAKHGYRAVVIGSDDECRAGPGWVASTGATRLPHGTAQRYYYALIDVRDRPGQAIAYVAEDHLRPLAPRSTSSIGDAVDLDSEAVERVVVHPLVPLHFASFEPSTGRFIPHTPGAVGMTAGFRPGTARGAAAAQ